MNSTIFFFVDKENWLKVGILLSLCHCVVVLVLMSEADCLFIEDQLIKTPKKSVWGAHVLLHINGESRLQLRICLVRTIQPFEPKIWKSGDNVFSYFRSGERHLLFADILWSLH